MTYQFFSLILYSKNYISSKCTTVKNFGVFMIDHCCDSRVPDLCTSLLNTKGWSDLKTIAPDNKHVNIITS